jgi:hypothetical protein
MRKDDIIAGIMAHESELAKQKDGFLSSTITSRKLLCVGTAREGSWFDKLMDDNPKAQPNSEA